MFDTAFHNTKSKVLEEGFSLQKKATNVEVGEEMMSKVMVWLVLSVFKTWRRVWRVRMGLESVVLVLPHLAIK